MRLHHDARHTCAVSEWHSNSACERTLAISVPTSFVFEAQSQESLRGFPVEYWQQRG
jgi:hypothetical protein